jgi:hypothetical protein
LFIDDYKIAGIFFKPKPVLFRNYRYEYHTTCVPGTRPGMVYLVYILPVFQYIYTGIQHSNTISRKF